MSISQQDPPRTSPPSSFTEPHRPGPNPRGLIAAVLGLLIVVVAAAGATVPTGAPAHQLWSTATGTLTQAAADPQAAVQAVIQQSNTEQAQALASSNPALMSDTATAAYYRQLVQINQGLVAQGATSIELTKLTWGPITVNGSTATAATTETWLTTFNDGTTTEFTGSNVYTLVLQSGMWLIESDQQPTASASAQPTPGISTQPTPQAPVPAVPAGANTSHNWSGYAASGGRYTGVSGTWTVPQPRVSGAPGVGATWVGIGGVTSHDLIQAGTQDVAAGGGQAPFQTWIEMLPQASQQVPLAVEPGDSVTVAINEQGAGTGAWQISMKNNTSGQSYQTSVTYASSESSVEWIEEAPSGASGVLPLDQFNSVSFSAGSAVQNGQPADLTQANAQAITMLNSSSQPLAVPSAIGSDGSSFNVARTSAPATTGNGSGPAQRRPTPTAGVGAAAKGI